MLKKIKSSQLLQGMYIHNLKCSWLDHPFAGNKFKLESETDIRKIIVAGITEVEIDTSKGLDVFVEKLMERRQYKNKILRSAVDESLAKPAIKVKTHAKDETREAKVAFAEAGQLITNMMSDVKMGKQVEMELVNPVINKMSESILRNHNALLGLSRIRIMDKYTFEHSVSIAVLMMSFAKSMAMSDDIIREVGVGGLLHDIGKTLTPDEILNKPGKLTDEEFVIMRRHVVDSRIILEKTPNLSQIALDVAAQHHERYDGTGYPNRLKGDEISLYGQMSAIVDVYDAITANRCYHKGEEPSVVLKLLMKWSNSHFNPELVQKFVQSVGIYPAGSLVMLSNHHLAKVIDIENNILKPIVEVFLNSKTRSYISPQIINLRKTDKLKIISAESYNKWNIKP
ncbi:MAG: HD-GYP domain-containing protein [Pseudomonadota bacterium]